MQYKFWKVSGRRLASLIAFAIVLLIGLSSTVDATPIAVIGGPYETDEGTSITLSAAGSYDPGGVVLNYRWDFTNDGVWDTLWSASPTVSKTYYDDFNGLAKVQVAQASSNPDLPTSLKAVASSQVIVHNVPPSIVLDPIRSWAYTDWLPAEAADIDFGPYPLLHTGETVHICYWLSDKGADAPYTWTLDDGNEHITSGIDYNNAHPFSQHLTYDTAGIYTATYTVDDGDGGTCQASSTVKVSGIADFTYSPSNPSRTDVVQFTDTSSSPNGPIVSWTWFDGLTYSVFSHEQSPTYQFAEYNDNYVGLIVTDSTGESSVMYKEIDVNTGLKSGFTFTPENPSVGEPVQFTNTASGLESITEYSWDFGDGDYTDDALPNPAHTYAEPGDYTVELWVYDGWGFEASASRTITIRPSGTSPSAAFSWSQTAPTTADDVLFSDTSTDADGTISTRSWNFGDGSPPEQGTQPSHRFAAPGTYSVTLTVTDNDGRTGSVTQAVTVIAYQSATYDLSLPGTTISGQQIVIDKNQVSLAGGSVSTPGNTIVVSLHGLITTITVDSPTDEGATVSGMITSVAVQSQPLPCTFTSTGPVAASFTAYSAMPIGGDATIAATLQETIGQDVLDAFQLAATSLNLMVRDVAYAMAIEKSNIPAGTITSATIQMTASAAWVAEQGGVDNIRIVRYDNGIATLLDTTGVLDAGVYRFTASSPSFSLFGLAGVNHPPSVVSVTTPLDPVQLGATVEVSAGVSDADIADPITATWQWGDGSQPSAGLITQEGIARTVTGSHTYGSAGVYTVKVLVSDGSADVSKEATQYVVVFDPSAGFVTGGGWITSPTGAYVADSTLTGRATFGFVSKYLKGATTPTGQTEFQFRVANLNFHSDSYDWLVVAGAKAQYKGSGMINGAGDYDFLLTAIDGQVTGGGGVDKFRLKVWDRASGTTVYDNQLGAADGADPTTVIGGGSIVLHKK